MLKSSNKNDLNWTKLLDVNIVGISIILKKNNFINNNLK